MNRLIVALDLPSQREALALVDEIDDAVEVYKVGLELYTREGPGMVRALHGRGKRVFLDLKLHDIPTTVARAVEAARALEVEFLTVHTSGGRPMMEAAREAAGDEMKLLGVTLLTSLDAAEVSEVWGRPLDTLDGEVIRLAEIARATGLSGVVASGHEARALRKALGTEALIVTPGIRLDSGGNDDQARVSTPRSAIAAGASHLVVGRPVTRAESPRSAARAFQAAIHGTTEARS
ncbi:MAG: orotidine-5'-phosphate decarboxylase [Longimicrobiales bacterium]|nr:orotidine-5'-phosphate decarboxylase [Longimicrobiales bacterium]